ncbi:hypothetical protein SAMN04487948_12563 [Halogranum amylolyticum]|uniref:Lipoprotein n=1 Tax=Halogranum amylolyticum TaxID=660520 RepID=A0A1H8W9R3_9EURY|nr:hypothetical protein [Halogranum amylolyticum]SEP24137.1 hypothetical protein SAMN04487948_12563 [Halogranum amylolyticum]
MGPLTRRRALHGATALLAGLAGCSGSSSSSRSSSPTAAESGGSGDTDPESYTLRGPTDDPLVRTGDASTDTPTDRLEERRWHHEFVTSADAAESLRFADVDGVDGARAFLAETSFETETVYVERRTVGECWELDLCYVRWGPKRVETDYGRRLRAADVACSADEQVAVATFVRIPARLDPEEIRQYGSGTSSDGCRLPPQRRDDGETGAGVETTGAEAN